MTGYTLDTSAWIELLWSTRTEGVARGYLLSSDPESLVLPSAGCAPSLP